MMKIKDIIRDGFHAVLGAFTAYAVFTITQAIYFTDESKIIGALPVSMVLGTSINSVFNWFQGLMGIESKSNEYYLGALGGLFGGACSLISPNETLALAGFFVCLLVCITDLYLTVKSRKNGVN